MPNDWQDRRIPWRQETKTGLEVATGIFLGATAVAVGLATSYQNRGHDVPAAALAGIGISVTLTDTITIAGTPTDVVDDAELHQLVDAHNRAP